MTAAKNVVMTHRGVDKGAEGLYNAWRRADLRRSNVRRASLAALYRSYVCDFVIFAVVVFLFFFCNIGESGMGPAPALFHCWAANPSRCFSLCLYTSIFHSSIIFSRCPLFPRAFFFRCVSHSLSLSSSVWVIFHCLYDCLFCVAC